MALPNVTQDAISHQIKNLEEFLEISLLKRRTKQLIITEAGQIYSNVLKDIFDKLDNETNKISKTSY